VTSSYPVYPSTTRISRDPPSHCAGASRFDPLTTDNPSSGSEVGTRSTLAGIALSAILWKGMAKFYSRGQMDHRDFAALRREEGPRSLEWR
jgi:hypothetical protein